MNRPRMTDAPGLRIGLIVLSLLLMPGLAGAELPPISGEDLVKAVQFADSLQKDHVCKYSVEEKFNMAVHGGRMPEHRRLDIELRRDRERYYTDVTNYDGTLIQDKPVRMVLTFDGEKRMQWTPNENKGDVFASEFQPAWPQPSYWDASLGRFDETLGDGLARSRVVSIRPEGAETHDCYYVEVIQPNGARAELWLDPAVGWRARRIKLYRTDGLLQYEAQTSQFKDCGNGVWFPVEGTAQLYAKDPATGERVVSCERRLHVTETRINCDLMRKDFEVDFPNGTEVYDHVQGIGFVKGVTSLEGVSDGALNLIAEEARRASTQRAGISGGELDPNAGNPSGSPVEEEKRLGKNPSAPNDVLHEKARRAPRALAAGLVASGLAVLGLGTIVLISRSKRRS
jgi:hypothetical protein